MTHQRALVLLGFIIAAVIAGGLTGWYWGAEAVKLSWLGTFFLNTLKMLIIPLIVASVITGTAALGDVRKLGRLGAYTIVYFLTTTGLAVFIGLLLVNGIQPGSGLTPAQIASPTAPAQGQTATLTDIVLSLTTPNLFAAAADMQVLPLIIFAIAFAAALTTLPSPYASPVLGFFNGLNETLMKLVVWVMYLAPIGIYALVAARLGKAGGGEAFINELLAVGSYVATILIGLSIHFLILTGLLIMLGHRGLAYLVGMLRALFTAFGTASSSATLPLTIECVREQGISERISKFILPLGCTINMNGTALYEAVAAMFIAQAYGIDLSLGQQIIVFITATLAAIGAAGIPEAGLVTMVIVLSAVGLPLEGIGLLLAVDWFLDRFRTTVNVYGDMVGAAIMHYQLQASSYKPQAKS